MNTSPITIHSTSVVYLSEGVLVATERGTAITPNAAIRISRNDRGCLGACVEGWSNWYGETEHYADSPADAVGDWARQIIRAASPAKPRGCMSTGLEDVAMQSSSVRPPRKLVDLAVAIREMEIGHLPPTQAAEQGRILANLGLA